MINAGENLTTAKQFARKLSADNPGEYVLLVACFGLFATLHARLNVYAPTDSCVDMYWLNGKAYKFTERQRIADQNQTPTLT
jgi:hypothetical protein